MFGSPNECLLAGVQNQKASYTSRVFLQVKRSFNAVNRTQCETSNFEDRNLCEPTEPRLPGHLNSYNIVKKPLYLTETFLVMHFVYTMKRLTFLNSLSLFTAHAHVMFEEEMFLDRFY